MSKELFLLTLPPLLIPPHLPHPTLRKPCQLKVLININNHQILTNFILFGYLSNLKGIKQERPL